jgi:hypothetical protein
LRKKDKNRAATVVSPCSLWETARAGLASRTAVSVYKGNKVCNFFLFLFSFRYCLNLFIETWRTSRFEWRLALVFAAGEIRIWISAAAGTWWPCVPSKWRDDR